MLSQICQELTTLSPADIQQLEDVSRQLPLMAELTGADVFIDCPTKDNEIVVVAQAKPTSGSAYEKSVIGEIILRQKEPAVFHALKILSPARDIKAITQENHTVRQDVVPIFNPEQRCIALLIRELDISDDVLQEKKYQSLARTYEKEDSTLRSSQISEDTTTLREVHHRVKNNLQLVASILNIQARRCGNDFTKKILQENVSRVLSIAAIHDILTQNRDGFHQIDSMTLLEQLRKNLQAFVPDGKSITISVSGSSVMLSPDTASSVSLVVNELITNALEHAFEDRDSGSIQVAFLAGSLFHTVTVADNGSGFDVTTPRTGSLGLNIVDATVRDRLRGHMTVYSSAGGTRISFDFKAE
ncbi:MAG: sensor histidine kinase [Ruminiclostridium sp.]|nr:sensor histidine kinase [Ruminiclostridium sp.]